MPNFDGLFAAVFLMGILACLALLALGWLAVFLFHHLHWVMP
jgi:hypothetical protein